MEASKTQYEVPTLTVVGTFESLTQATGIVSRLDASFPSGTPDEDLTFS